MKNHQVALRRLATVASVFGLIVAVAPAARASFTYSVSPVSLSTNFGAGSNLTINAFNNGGPSPFLDGSQDVLLVHVTNTSTTVAPPTDTASVSGSVTVTINNLNGGGSGSFVVAGTIVVTRSDTLGAASTFTLTSILPPMLILGAFDYTLSNPVYIPPTIQAGQPGSGGIAITITETPEPA
jgi:hypothetical protein